MPLLSTQASAAELTYPETRKIAQVDTYHGTKVPDPYRWLEDLDSAETRAWIAAQNSVTDSYLEGVEATRMIQERLRELWNYERYGVPFKRGGKYFYRRNDGLQNQSVLYVRGSLDGEARVLIDPNMLSEDGTVALTGVSVSDDGKYLAYGLSEGGSDWQEWHVRSVADGKDLDDHLQWVKFSSAAWNDDGTGFYYSRYDAPGDDELKAVNRFQKLYFHRLGTDQSEDELIYHRPDQPDWGFFGQVTDDGNYLVIYVWKGTDERNLIFYRDLREADAPIVELFGEFKHDWNLIGNQGDTFYFRTDAEAPKYRIVAVDLDAPDALREIVAESENTLEGASMLNNELVASYLVDARSVVSFHSLTGEQTGSLDLPGIGTVSGFEADQGSTETFFAFTSFATPTTIYRYDMERDASEVFATPSVDFDSEAYVVEQVFYESKDGTRVPMFLVSRKGIERDGNNPTLLYGYGGFNISLTPAFSPSRIAWLEMGGVYAVANIRGGGEYGKDWHQAGTRLNKQNVFDDFIAAAEYLVEKRYTSPEKLAIEGGSNGGLLVAATMLQRPDLFGAVVPRVGVLDMLRFNQFTIGWAWESDYGSPQNPEEFAALYAYSPLHNLDAGTEYPATLITTGDHDDRVFPAHSFKFAAALQEAHGGSDPVLIRIETRAGHGAGKPVSMQIEEQADIYAFLVKALAMDSRESRVLSAR